MREIPNHTWSGKDRQRAEDVERETEASAVWWEDIVQMELDTIHTLPR